MHPEQKIQTGAEHYEDRVQANDIVKAVVNQVVGKKWCIEQAVKAFSAPENKCSYSNPVELASAMYDFMCKV